MYVLYFYVVGCICQPQIKEHVMLWWLKPQAEASSQIRRRIFVHSEKNYGWTNLLPNFLRHKSNKKNKDIQIFPFYLEKITSVTTSNSFFSWNQAYKLQNSAFVCESVTVLTFEQLWLGLNSLLQVFFSSKLLTVLSCNNYSNPDISWKRWHLAKY